MKGLEKFLVETILGEAAQMDKVVVVYSGRFQPFHKGHYATYENLVRKFGKDSVYIGTSNVTDSKKSPFNFKEKKAIMMQMFGIPSSKIVNIKNPYAPEEILNKYDSDTTGLIVVVGEKDQNRLSGKYFTPYKGKVEQGYLDKGYVYASPAQSNPISGTDVRYWLSAGSSDDRKKNFTKAYPKFDSQIFKLITLKLKGLKECINEEIKLNVKVGDTLLMGKFKNKKVVVKSIGEDEWGMPTINGKKAVTFRIPKKENLKETASNGGFRGQDEPDTSFVADGQPRILNKAKPEGWYKQGGYTQIDTPKADAMRGRGKSKDTETQFRKAYYKLKNVTQSTLNPADDPFKVEDWQDAYRENPNEKPKRFWEMPDNQKDTIISKEDIKEIVSDFDSILDEMGLGGGAGVGLSLPGGYINGAPKADDVKKVSKKLNNKGMSGYEEIDEDKIPGGLANGKTLIDLAKKWDSKGYYEPKQFAAKYIKPQLMKGIKVEMEHTTDVRIATEIAMDHLWEDLKYYDKLAKIENPTNEGLKDLEKELVVLYNKAFKMMPKSPAQMKVRAEIDKLKKQIDKLKNETTIVEYTGNGAFPQDGNTTTGYIWNSDWDDYDNQKYYLDKLEGWDFFDEIPSEREKKKTVDQKLPIDNHKDTTDKYNRILKHDLKSPIDFLKESLLTEGGAYGHMNHPFDIEMNLTFGDLKQIVVRALNGDLELAREKTDGQALAVSWVNGRLVAARNKSHLKNKGAGAMTIGQVADKFAGRGGLTDAYNFAMQDLSKAIAALS
jgi:hypothetical protein